MDESFEERIRNIRRRIEELRKALHSSEQRTEPQNEKVAPGAPPLGNTQNESEQKRNAELDSIRQKLMKYKQAQ